MRKLVLFTLVFFVAAASSFQIFAQSAGTNPQIFLYRYNSSPTISPLPVVQGNLLGTFRWNGLVNYGDIRTGASIHSVVTAPVGPGFQANMIFSTSGAGGLTNRVIITDDGRVGIGTMTPLFDLHTVGNTHTTGRFHGRIHFDFDAPGNNGPNTYTNEAYFERKLRATLGVPAVAGINNFGGILSLAPGGGAHDHQLFFGQDGVWNRREAENNAAWTGAWEKLLSSADISGRPNLVARFRPPGPVSSALTDGQIFDDGANVVIGNIPAAPAVASPAFDAADMLTVNGRTFFNGTARVGVNALVDGNLGVGTIAPAYKIHLVGDSYFAGRMAIGPTDHFASGYALSVNGKIITDEVRVMLEPSWPDYVFEQSYDLKPLPEVETYIQQHKHLPGVASAKEVAEQGLDVGLMQKAQMEKIEELFLHLIELEKQVTALKVENEQLKAKVEQLGQR